jgi:hypothetical protein
MAARPLHGDEDAQLCGERRQAGLRPLPLSALAQEGLEQSGDRIGYGYNYSNLGYVTTLSGYDPYVKMQAVLKPSQTIFSGDGLDVPISGDWDYLKLYRPSFGANGVGNRHENGICLAWVDGHAEWLPRKVLMLGVAGNVDYYYNKTK